MVESHCPRSSEMAAETIAGATWAGVQEPNMSTRDRKRELRSDGVGCAAGAFSALPSLSTASCI
jgi:hypothetical protein